MERVAKELGSIAQSKDTGQKKLDEHRREVVVRRLQDLSDKTVGKEAKAEIEKAAAKVAELTASLRAKQKELAEAQSKLARLKIATGAEAVVVARAQPRTDARESVSTYRFVTPKTAETVNTRIQATPSRIIRDVGVPADAKRLEDLEKKLDRLLEEVAGLKKDRSKEAK